MGGGQIPWKKALRNTWMAPNIVHYSNFLNLEHSIFLSKPDPYMILTMLTVVLHPDTQGSLHSRFASVSLLTMSPHFSLTALTSLIHVGNALLPTSLFSQLVPFLFFLYVLRASCGICVSSCSVGPLFRQQTAFFDQLYPFRSPDRLKNK